jgi:L-iditol 2-dehydrogenase
MQALVFDPPRLGWPLFKLAGLVRRSAATGPLSGLRLREVPPPALPGPEWVRLRTLLGGICGTDLALVAGRNHPATFLQRFASFPAVLGHENVCVIAETGAQCAAGRTSLCENTDRGMLPPGLMIGLNARTGGSWSPEFVAHESQVFAVPDEIPDENAVLTDPLACAVHAVLRRPPRTGEQVLLNGGGIMGVGLAAAIRALGCRNRVVGVVRHPFQADLLRRYDAEDVRVHPRSMTHEERYDDVARAVGGRRLAAPFGNQAFVGGADLTYDSIGTGRSITDCLKWTAARGTVVLVGTSQISVVDTTPLWFAELNVVGCNGRQIEDVDGRRMHTYEVVFEWIRTGRLRVDGLLTHRFALGDYRSGLRALLTRSDSHAVKAAFVPV